MKRYLFISALFITSNLYAISSILRPLFFNVKDHGAVANGVTDDTGAFNLTVAAATTSAAVALGAGYGSVIYFPAGQYKGAFQVNGQRVSIFGDVGSTYLIPLDTFTFTLSFKDSNITDPRFVDGIFFSSSGSHGRGLYINSPGFINVQNCTFGGLEYNVYSNGSEWNHFFNCRFQSGKYGSIFTTISPDITGVANNVNQNSAATWFEQCRWTNMNVAFFASDPGNGVGDHQPAFSFKQCEVLSSTAGLAAVMPGVNQNLYNQMSLDYVWVEQNDPNGTGAPVNVVVSTSVTTTINAGGLYMSGGTLDIEHGSYNDRLTLKNQARFSARNANFNGCSMNIDTDTVANMNDILADYQNGFVFDWAYIDNLQSINPDRPILARTHHHTGFTNAGAYKNVLSGVTSTCSTGTLPSAIAGSPTISYFSNDGFFSNKSVKIVGVAGDSVRWPAVVASTNWYVTTFAVRTDTATTIQTSTFTITNNTKTIVPTQRAITVSPTWRTYGSVGQPATSGTANLDITLQTATTLYFSLFQVAEFPALQEAKDFYNSSAFLVPLSEYNIFPSTK